MFEIGSAVFFNCLNPATGFIKRMAKDKSWADVEWHSGLNQSYTQRVKTENLLPTCTALNHYKNYIDSAWWKMDFSKKKEVKL